jgi:FMN phosphatase YigB (HAD superfamily)
MTKAISFDVWNTLIQPNPEFAKQRKRLLAETFGEDERTCAAAFTKVKTHVDNMAEQHGIGYYTHQNYQMLVNELQSDMDIAEQTLLALKVNVLFAEYPPLIAYPVREAVKMASNNGMMIGIGSNSNFISGSVMQPFLEKAFRVDFDFCVYSDLFPYAKPHPEFFYQIAYRAGVPVDRIVHIGDNAICDGGADKVNMKSRIIASPDDVFNAVKEICNG